MLIEAVLEAWTTSRVTEVAVVVREDDVALRDVCRRWPVWVVCPAEPTADMKASVIVGLDFLRRHFRPLDSDRCFIAPADLPNLSHQIIDRLVASPAERSMITVPMFGDRRGHPALLPWELTAEIYRLPLDQGVNQVVDRHPRQTVSFPADPAVDDVDTPQEYFAALQSARNRA